MRLVSGTCASLDNESRLAVLNQSPTRCTGATAPSSLPVLLFRVRVGAGARQAVR